MIIFFNGMDLIGLAISGALIVICGIIVVIGRIVYAIKKSKNDKR